MRPHSGKRTDRLIELVGDLRDRFDRKSEHAKIALLAELSARQIGDADSLETYHDTLCFMRAYPDSPRVLQRVEQELGGFGARVEFYKGVSRDRRAKKLLDTGIANTAVLHEFNYTLTTALSEWFGECVEIDWDRYDRLAKDTIADLLPVLVAWHEIDALENDETLETADWLAYARGPADPSSLSALLRMFRHAGLDPMRQRHLYESAEIPVRWTLTDCPASRTLKRVPWKKTFFQRGPLKKRPRDLRAELAKTPSPLTLLPPGRGAVFVRHIQEILGVRCRELRPLIHSNAAEVYVNEPGRGVQLVTMGSRMDARLPLEANMGAMLVRNGMPVGYALGSMLFDRAEVAINVFPAHRGGESPFVMVQFFRLLHHHFGARVFLVRSYQVGDENDEALESGSFWFYYKLGFRPIRERIRGLADEEFRKIQSTPSHRTPKRMLKRLSKSDVFFHVDPDAMDGYEELPLTNLGYMVTKYIAERYDGRRDEAVAESVKYVARILNAREWRRWSHDEITGFERLAPLIAMFPDLEAWTAREKSSLVRLIRAKGGKQERDFVDLSNRHSKFRRTVEDLGFGRLPPRYIRSPLGFPGG